MQSFGQTYYNHRGDVSDDGRWVALIRLDTMRATGR